MSDAGEIAVSPGAPGCSPFCCCSPVPHSPRRRHGRLTPEQDPFYRYEGKTRAEADRTRNGPEDADRSPSTSRASNADHGRSASLPLDVGARQADRQRDLGAAAAGETQHVDGAVLSIVLRQSQHRRRPVLRNLRRLPGRRNRAGRVGAGRAGAARRRDRHRARHRGRGSGLLRPGPYTATTRSTRCARRSARRRPG